MEKWLVTWVHGVGKHEEIVDADTLPAALDRFRDAHPDVPSIALIGVSLVVPR